MGDDRLRPGWPVRVALAAGCLGYAALALASGLDRKAATDAATAAAIPDALAAQGLVQKGAAALARGNSAQALALGHAAVRRAPLEPASPALLGAARLATRDFRGAEAAFRVAGRMGWRVPMTQNYWMQQALAQGDYPVASMRLDALLRQYPGLLQDQALLAPIDSNPRGRAALAARLLAGPEWLAPYLAVSGTIPAPAVHARAGVLSALAAQGGQVGCDGIAPLVDRLIALGAMQDAAALWRAHCPGSRQHIVYDGQFRAVRIDQTHSAFAWFFVGQNDVSVIMAPSASGQGRGLVIDGTNRRARQFVRQRVMLERGDHVLSWRARDAQGQPSDRVLAAFGCGPDPQGTLQPRLDPASGRWTVPLAGGEGCNATWLAFALAPGGGTVSLEDVAIVPGQGAGHAAAPGRP